jgi:hypothetical protein
MFYNFGVVSCIIFCHGLCPFKSKRINTEGRELVDFVLSSAIVTMSTKV